MNQILKTILFYATSFLTNKHFRFSFISILLLTSLTYLGIFLWSKTNQPLRLTRIALVVPNAQVGKSLIEPPAQHTFNISYTIQDGDNLGDVLANYGISEGSLDRIMRLGEIIKPLRRIMPGHQLDVVQTLDSPLIQFTYHYAFDKDLIIHNTDDGYTATIKILPITTHNVAKQAIIRSSLFTACQHAGIPANLVQEFITKFSWDVDFAKDIREGDKVSMVYEELFNGDKKVGNGHLLAGGFINHGKTYTVFRYTVNGETDYYTGDGRSVRKRFLRAPVKFSHISSLFNLARMHPILHRIRAHQGVDYAAPYGTPIHATGNGKIAFQGRKGGYGNAVIIDHGNDYTTLYGHMSRFAHLHLGSRVKQGELIGYVGATGLATANHVHYEFRIHGQHFDPLKIKLPKSEPIAQRLRKAFFAMVQQFSSNMGLAVSTNGPQVAASFDEDRRVH